MDSLSTSTLIPVGVQIVRLADDLDAEGIMSNVNTIVVRYTGSSVNAKQKTPLVYEKDMSFTIEFYCQSYLSESGHDFAIQLMAATTQILSNQVPMGTGYSISNPFNLSNESFEGLTENSQYKYSQDWSLVSEEVYQPFALDPCVLRGNCEAVWPPKGVLVELKPWETLEAGGNGIYAPANSEGVLEEVVVDPEVGLVFRDSEEVFFAGDGWKSWVLSPGYYDGVSESRLISVKILDGEGEFIRESIFLPTGGFLPKLYSPELGPLTTIFSGKPLYVINNKTSLLSDPLSISPLESGMYPGRYLEIREEVQLTVANITYTLASKGAPKGTPWIRLSDITRVPNVERPGYECYEGATC